MTQYPSSDIPLPSDLPLLPSVAIQQQLAIRPVNSTTMSCPYETKADQFGRLAQAVSLLDQILTFNHPVVANKQDSILELKELDSRIRGFLSVVMSERGNTTTSGSTIVAIALRFDPRQNFPRL